MKTLVKKGLLNTVGDGVHLDTDTNTGISMLVVDHSANPLVPVINFPFKGGVKNVTKVVTAAEVRRMWQIGVDNDETVAFSTRYTVNVDHVEAKVGSERRGTNTPYSYTTPTATLGSAALDRSNLFTVLASKINAHANNYMTAYTIQQVSYTAGTSVGDVAEDLVIGELGTQETSGATVKFVKLTITSGTFAGDNAAGEIWFYDLTGTWNATSKTITWATTTSITITTAEALDVGAGLLMEDDAGYHVTPSETRDGASIVSINSNVAAGGGLWLTSTALIHRDRVYSQGVGTEMLLHTPLYSKSKEDALSGDMNYTFNESPVAGNTYTMLVIDISINSENVAGFGHANTQKVELQLFCEDSSDTYINTLITAIEALV